MPDAFQMTFIRWRRGESRCAAGGDRLPDRHPMIGTACPACRSPIDAEHAWQLLVVGPVDAADREQHDAGRWYSAAALVAHRACLDLPVADLDDLADSMTPDDPEEP